VPIRLLRPVISCFSETELRNFNRLALIPFCPSRAGADPHWRLVLAGCLVGSGGEGHQNDVGIVVSAPHADHDIDRRAERAGRPYSTDARIPPESDLYFQVDGDRLCNQRLPPVGRDRSIVMRACGAPDHVRGGRKGTRTAIVR
jgi:hypothetical protein